MEHWKDIKGYEGRYQVSDLGNVKSFVGKTPKLLVPKCNNSGRLHVQLSDGHNNVKYKLIHRLVGEAFIPNPDGLPQINHLDENPKNNRVENLEWCTHEYNVQYYAERHKGKPRTPWRYPQRIVQEQMDGKIVREWENITTIHRVTNLHSFPITECCKGNRKQAYGYKWHFA